MFEAYGVVEVAAKLPLEITAIAKQNQSLIAGTKSGVLLVYTPSKDGRRKADVKMCKTFAKKAIMQLDVIDSKNLLLCLSDNQIIAHDSIETNYPIKCNLLKTKGATSFCSHINLDNLLLAVAIRRKIHLFQLQNNDFIELSHIDLSFVDVVQSMTWCESHMAIAVRDEYMMVAPTGFTSDNTTSRSLFTTGNRVPLICTLVDRKIVGFCREQATVFTDYDGVLVTHEYPDIRWSHAPVALAYDAPYLVALLSSKETIEVRSVRPSLCIQIIKLNVSALVSGGSGSIYANSSHSLWLLSNSPHVRHNIQQLINEKQYELAVQVAERLDTAEVERNRLIQDIKRLHAFNLFCRRKFVECFAMYSAVQSDVLPVIGLFPRLLPDYIRKSLLDENWYPEKPPDDMAENDYRNGLRALANYLTEIRMRTTCAISMHEKLRNRPTSELNDRESALILSVDELKKQRNTLEIVDTTLLQCYVEANEAILVESLLRMPGNSCVVAVADKILRERNKYFELFLLYEKNKMHNEALELLKSQYKGESASLKGTAKTIHYLQCLGNNHIDLIFKYAQWVLWENEVDGLMIFTEDCEEVRTLDRELVMKYLYSERQSIVIPYLDHLIWHWDEKRPLFHNNLLELYIEKVKTLMHAYLQSLPDDKNVVRAGEEDGELGVYRSKLLVLLQFSQSFSPELLLVQINDVMYDERALILGRLKRHEQAIAIYANILHDYRAAERYCNQHYNRADVEDSQVFLHLLKMYAQPPDNTIIGLMYAGVSKPQPNIPQAIKILKDYPHRINTIEGINLLSGDARLCDVWMALEAILQSATATRRNMELHRALHYSSFLRASSRCSQAKNITINIGYLSECVNCRKKIGNSAFARFPDGRLVHYYCFKKN